MKGKVWYHVQQLQLGNGMVLVRKLRTANAFKFCTLAGGALRDMKAGVQPKDYDLITLDDMTAQELFKILKDAFNDDCIFIQDFDDLDYGDANVASVFKVKLFGYDVDIIEPKYRADSMVDVVSNFDMTINAIATNGRQVFDLTPEKGESVKIIDWGNLNWNRILKMYNKYPADYKWTDLLTEADECLGVPPMKKEYNALRLVLGYDVAKEVEIKNPFKVHFVKKQRKPEFINERNNWVEF